MIRGTGNELSTKLRFSKTCRTDIDAVGDVSILLLSVLDLGVNNFSGISMIDMKKSAHNKPL